MGILQKSGCRAPSLFATGLCPQIRAPAIELETPTYKDETESGGLADVPRILCQTDLPYVAGLGAPRPLLIKYPPEAEQSLSLSLYRAPALVPSRFRRGDSELRPAAESSRKELAGWFIENLVNAP